MTHISISPENIVTILLIVAIGYGLFALVGQGWQKFQGG